MMLWLTNVCPLTGIPTCTGKEQLVECSTTLNCSSNSTLMSARECCVNSVDGLSYSIQGQEQCHTCIGMSNDYKLTLGLQVVI